MHIPSLPNTLANDDGFERRPATFSDYLIELGHTQSVILEASKIFGVTIPTLGNWIARQKQQNLAPKMNGSKPSKIDNEKI